MKNKYSHIQLLKTWLLLPFFFYATCLLATSNGTSCESISFSKIQKSIFLNLVDNSTPFKSELPQDPSSENHLISYADIEEIVEPFALKNFTLVECFSRNADKLLISKCKEESNIPFYLDIVPPPPKR